MPTAPLVTVLLAVHDGETYVRTALESVLRQSVSDLELVVVDDASTDGTADAIARVRDPRLRVLRNEARLGLASSLNRGLDGARGRYVARLDADDVAMPTRLETQLTALRTRSLAIVASAVLDLDEDGRVGRLHVMPSSDAGVRWRALFGSPFFHPTVLVDREALDRHGLRYDSEYLESEDYDLWTRLLAYENGENLEEPLTLYRVHPGQASRARRGVQRSFQRRVALREIARVAPGLDVGRAELAWCIGSGEPVDPPRIGDALEAFGELLETFERMLDVTHETLGAWDVRASAAQAMVRAGLAAGAHAQLIGLASAALLDPALPARVARRRLLRKKAERRVHRDARVWLDELEAATHDGSPPIRVTAVFPEPTPYRAPLLDRVAALPEIDLTVVYAAETVARRTWTVEHRHRAVFLRGVRLPGAAAVLHHDYPLTPGIVGALTDTRPSVVVVSGWSTFAAQAAIAWCRLKRVPYVLVVESHDEGPRAGWRRRVKGTVVPSVVRNAASVLVTGTLARSSMVARGASPARVRVFANTIDIEGFGERASRLAERRTELRRALGAEADDVVVLSVARLAPEKGLDVLVRAVAGANSPDLLLLLAGDGPERDPLERLAGELGVRAVLAGDIDWEKLVELYVAADVFALLSEREPWAVVVNEAAACGLPLVLSDRVGAAHDLLVEGENGFLVPAGDVDSAARALRALASNTALRETQGARSRELARDWGYGPSVEGLQAAVREAAADRG